MRYFTHLILLKKNLLQISRNWSNNNNNHRCTCLTLNVLPIYTVPSSPPSPPLSSLPPTVESRKSGEQTFTQPMGCPLICSTGLDNTSLQFKAPCWLLQQCWPQAFDHPDASVQRGGDGSDHQVARGHRGFDCRRDCHSSARPDWNQVFMEETSQELRMLSSVTINCQITKIVMNSGSQLSEL